MNVGYTGFKSAIIATLIFNTLIISEKGFRKETLLILFLSFIVLFFISLFTIAISIFPIYNINKKRLTKK